MTTAICSLNRVWKPGKQWVNTKLCLYQSLILSILLYGSEHGHCFRKTWPFTSGFSVRFLMYVGTASFGTAKSQINWSANHCWNDKPDIITKPEPTTHWSWQWQFDSGLTAWPCQTWLHQIADGTLCDIVEWSRAQDCGHSLKLSQWTTTVYVIQWMIEWLGYCVCVCVFQMKGEAEAFAIEAKAKAEAEQMEKKASAWKEYQDAAVVDMILEVLPKVGHSFF